MDEQKVVEVRVMGASSGKKKNGDAFFKVDLYLDGEGGFDVMVTPEEYVKFKVMTPGTVLEMEYKLVVKEEKIPTASGGFTVRRLGIKAGALRAAAAAA